VTPFESNRKAITVLKSLSAEEVKKWAVTVHRWAKSLQKEPEYRARLLGSAYRAANLTPKEFYGNHENENEELAQGDRRKDISKRSAPC
jgi:hypothetical protein